MTDMNDSNRLDRIEALLDRAGQRMKEAEAHFTATCQQHIQALMESIAREEVMRQDWEQRQEEAARERERLDAMSQITDKRIAGLLAAMKEYTQSRERKRVGAFEA